MTLYCSYFLVLGTLRGPQIGRRDLEDHIQKARAKLLTQGEKVHSRSAKPFTKGSKAGYREGTIDGRKPAGPRINYPLSLVLKMTREVQVQTGLAAGGKRDPAQL